MGEPKLLNSWQELDTHVDNILVVKIIWHPNLPDFAVWQLPEYAPQDIIQAGMFLIFFGIFSIDVLIKKFL